MARAASGKQPSTGSRQSQRLNPNARPAEEVPEPPSITKQQSTLKKKQGQQKNPSPIEEEDEPDAQSEPEAIPSQQVSPLKVYVDIRTPSKLSPSKQTTSPVKASSHKIQGKNAEKPPPIPAPAFLPNGQSASASNPTTPPGAGGPHAPTVSSAPAAPNGRAPPWPEFKKLGEPITQVEYDYVIYKAAESQAAGVPLFNDFEPGKDERPIEIYEKWNAAECPASFKDFITAMKGKKKAPPPAPSPASSPPPNTTPSPPATPHPKHQTAPNKQDQASDFMGAVSSEFGLPKAKLDGYVESAVARAFGSSSFTKKSASVVKYKPLKGEARSEVLAQCDSALTKLAQISAKYGTDPAAATNLFRAQLSALASSAWSQWQMREALKNPPPPTDADGPDEEDEEDEEEPKEDELGEDAEGAKPTKSKQRAKAYWAEKNAAVAGGPEAFGAWASELATETFAGITGLHQRVSSDHTRAKVAAKALEDLDSYARSAWSQHGIACVGFVTGAAQGMPSTHDSRIVFGPTSEVKNIFFNGVLSHPAQQLYFTSGISLAFAGNVIAGELPIPPPVFSRFEFPRHLTSGVPKGQAFTPILPAVSYKSHQAASSKSGDANTRDQKKEKADKQEEALRDAMLEATPGSQEAEDLMERIELEVPAIAKAKGHSQAAVLGRFASTLWKKKQGTISKSNERGDNYATKIGAGEIQVAALGTAAHHSFIMRGFPCGFPYPATANELKQALGQKKLKETLPYAVIKACLVGTPDEEGEPCFLEFEVTEWDRDVLNRRKNAACVYDTNDNPILWIPASNPGPTKQPTARARSKSKAVQTKNKTVRVDSASDDEPQASSSSKAAGKKRRHPLTVFSDDEDEPVSKPLPPKKRKKSSHPADQSAEEIQLQLGDEASDD